jgi:hypothetical protein
MSEADQQHIDLKKWIALWPQVRHEVEDRLAEHAKRDPSLHFEPALAELELKDIDEALRRIEALSTILYGDDMSSAEREGTGNV